MAANGVEIYLKLLYHLCIEHIDYALNLTLQGIGDLLFLTKRSSIMNFTCVSLNFLHRFHLRYFYLSALPPAEPKSPPEGLFFKAVEQANAIFHLLEKHFTDCVIGLVA